MEKFELSTRRSLAIVSYIAASMGYSKEEIKFITAGMLKKNGEVNEFHKILTEPLDKIVRVEHKGEVKDLVEPFNLVERIQMVIELILNKSTVTEPVNLKPTASIYQYSPFKFSNFIRNPKEEPGLTAREEYLADEAIRKATEETLRELKGKEVEIPNPKSAIGARNSEEIEEVNQAIESLIRLRNKIITSLNEQNEEQPKFNWDNIQKAQEQPEPYEPVKFTEEQRQRQREILGNPFASTSRYDQIGNDKVKKLNEYVIRSNTGNEYVPYSFLSPLDDKPLFDQMLHDRTETEAMISRSIEIYPSMDLCKDTLFKVNKPEEMFSFVRVDGDRLYRINDSSVQPWNRSKLLGTIRLISEDFGLFTSVKLTVEVNESVIEEIVDRNYVDVISILKDINKKHGTSITPDDINADLPAENLGQYLLRNTFGRLVDEVRKDRAHLIKTLVRDSAIVVINDMELTNWLKGKNPTNS